MFETVDLPDCPALVTRDCRGLAVNVTENERRQLGFSNNTRHLCADILLKNVETKTSPFFHFSSNKWLTQSKRESVLWTFKTRSDPIHPDEVTNPDPHFLRNNLYSS